MPANCGLFVGDRETPVRTGLRGGAGRTQTSNQTGMSWKDSNLNQAVMSEPLRLRKRVIFPPTGRKVERVSGAAKSSPKSAGGTVLISAHRGALALRKIHNRT